jgi:hypothetical protein
MLQYSGDQIDTGPAHVGTDSARLWWLSRADAAVALVVLCVEETVDPL